MEVYGVPDDVNIMVLRSYLRPSNHDHWRMLQSPIRVSTKQRLERISEVSPLTWWDYIRYEPTLWMSLMVAMLCFYATVSSAMRRSEIAEPAESESVAPVPHGILERLWAVCCSNPVDAN